MNKIIVLAVVFGLVMGAAFAEVAISGAVGMNFIILEGDSTEKDKDDPDPAVFTGLGDHWGGVDFVWASDEGVAGAKVKINGDTNKGHEKPPVNTWDPDQWPMRIGAGIWWRPLEVLKVTFWHIEDEGALGRGNAIDWGLQANSAAGPITAPWAGGWNSFSNATLRTGNGFFGGTGGGANPHLALEIFPIDGLTIGLAWDVVAGKPTEDFLKETFAQVAYEIDGIGNFAVSFAGNHGFWSAKTNYGGHIAQTLGVDFFVTALDGMSIGVGALIPIAGKTGTDKDAKDFELPVEIGLEYTLNQWSGEAFHLYARAGVQLPTEDTGDYTAIGLDINPSYDIGIFRIYFDFGIALSMVKDVDDIDFFWHFTPYLKKSLGGVGDLYFGLNFWNGEGRNGYEADFKLQGKDSTEIVNFRVPVFFEMYF